MREILFKAQNFYSGEWVEGYFVKRENIDEGYILTDIYDQITNGQRYLRSDLMECGNRVSTKTVCQYTGLKDKNGVKIFENDLVEYKYKLKGIEHTKIYTVEWDENEYPLFNYDTGFRPEQLTVVGNIYDEKRKA